MDTTPFAFAHEIAWRDFWARSGVELADRDLQHWWYRMMYFARTVSQPGGRFLEITSTIGGTLRLLNPWTGKIIERATQPGQRLAFTGNEE